MAPVNPHGWSLVLTGAQTAGQEQEIAQLVDDGHAVECKDDVAKDGREPEPEREGDEHGVEGVVHEGGLARHLLILWWRAWLWAWMDGPVYCGVG